MGFLSINEMLESAKKENKPLWLVIAQDDMKERAITLEQSKQEMQAMYDAMRKSLEGYDAAKKSRSQLVGGDAAKVRKAMIEGRLVCGTVMDQVMMRAICVGECNACMKRIVAAPTAGSCGVLPAVLITLQEEKGLTDEKMTEALFVAAGIGKVIAERASISGAEGGCQAEIGSASSMAAAAAAYLNEGDNEAVAHAAAIALKNLLGLVCDPVAGLVEVPCVKRNVIGAFGAMAAADMAIAGIKSVIPPDEVIDAMAEIGSQLPKSLKETAEGGLAATPTGISIAEKNSRQ